MFIYWDGYEIDGSDTDFNILLPENIQVCEFVECFLSLPIFDKIQTPSIGWYQNNKLHELTVDELKEKLQSGSYPEITVNVNCLHMELLSDDLQQSLYSISERREPREEAFGKVENPCMAPVVQKYYTRGELTVELRIQKSGSVNPFSNEDNEIDGYTNNIELLRSGAGLPSFEINVGPSFYYEYAIYIIDALRDSFPDLATCGGLDCGGGWTEGCTYADSIYYYEKILLPVKHSINNTLKRLTAYNIVRSYRSYYERSLQYNRTEGFYLANNAPVEPGETLKPITFKKYLELVETTLSLDQKPFDTICDTAVQIILPQPDEFAENPKVVERLKSVLPELNGKNNEWYFTGYFAFAPSHDGAVAEFRLYYPLKPYLLSLLALAEAGELDFIKPLTYERRQND